jgi:hypothetical protein
VSDRGREPEPGPETRAEAPDLDLAGEPEPEWAEWIRRARRERAERLREILDGTPDEELPL